MPMNRRNLSITPSGLSATLGGRGSVDSVTPNTREVVQIAGDVPDPTGISGHRGLMSSTAMTAGKQEVVVVFQDLLLTVDLYALPGEPMKVHLICPRCHKMLQIRGDQKRIEYDPRGLNPMGFKALEIAQDRAEIAQIAQFGRLSIETFECTWEVGDARHVKGAVHTGASLCRLRLVIDDNRAREV